MDLSDLIARNAAFTPDKVALRYGGRCPRAMRRSLQRIAARGARAQIGARRRPRRPRRDPRRQSPRLPRAALCLRAARRAAGAAQLAARGARAALHSGRRLGQGCCSCRTPSPRSSRRCGRRSPISRIIRLDDETRRRHSFEHLLAQGRGDDRNPHIDASSPLLLVYTSGTTGRPKGAVLRQEALLWNAVMSQHMHDLTASDHVLTVLPLFHVGGLNIQTTPALQVGATVTLHARFAPDATLAAFARGAPDPAGAGARHHPGPDRAPALGGADLSQPARGDHRLDPGAASA